MNTSVMVMGRVECFLARDFLKMDELQLSVEKVRKSSREEVLHDSSFGKSIEDSTDIRVTFHDSARRFYYIMMMEAQEALLHLPCTKRFPFFFVPPHSEMARESQISAFEFLKYYFKALTQIS